MYRGISHVRLKYLEFQTLHINRNQSNDLMEQYNLDALYDVTKNDKYLVRRNNFCKQAKENLKQWGGRSSTVSTGKEHVREAQRSRVETNLCRICKL